MYVLFEGVFFCSAVKSGTLAASFDQLGAQSLLTQRSSVPVSVFLANHTGLDWTGKTMQPKVKPKPWLSYRTHAARQKCRKAERKCKKDKL